MSAIAAAAARSRAASRVGAVEALFLASLFCVTFEKVHWNVTGAISISDILAALFVAAYLLGRIERRDTRLPRSAAVVLLFVAALLLVYLLGFFDLDSPDAATQFGKGITKSLLHLLLLVCGIAYLARRSQRFYWKSLGWLTAGMVANAAYGIVQLLLARSGVNLDSLLLSKITGGASDINLYGVVEGASVYRTNALTGDPNHLGIMLDIPLLVLTPVYLRLEWGHEWRKRIGIVLGFLLLVELTTLSRSGLLGLLVGGLVLLVPYRRRLLSRAVLVPVGAVAVVLGLVILARLHYFETVLASRVQTGGTSTSGHFGVYALVPDALALHPVFGLGLNTFSVYYELITGKTNWGPHSFYVALLIETGIVGTLVFGAFIVYMFRRLGAIRRLGKALMEAGDPLGRRVRPLGWGMTAALAGTMAANVFYLTMQFYYFYVFAVLAFAAPAVFRRSGTAGD